MPSKKTKPSRTRRSASRPRKSATTDKSQRGSIDLDEIDQRIIAALRSDGRISNRELAVIAQVNEATVRSRLRRLEESNTVRVVAIRDLSAMGYKYLSAVGVQVKGRSAEDVGQDLAKIPEVLTVNQTIGAHDLEVQVVAADVAEIGHLLTHVLANVKGVARLTPGLALSVMKYESQWAPLT